MQKMVSDSSSSFRGDGAGGSIYLHRIRIHNLDKFEKKMSLAEEE
jgi:hypothetical protein